MKTGRVPDNVQELLVEKLSYSTLSEMVYERIRDGILNRKYRNGGKMNQKELAIALGVSITPVRDALRRLAHEGLIEVVPRSSTKVLAPTPSDIRETYEVRKVLEEYAVGCACSKMGDRELEEFSRLFTSAEDRFRYGDVSAFIESDRCFHETIANACGNSKVAQFLGMIQIRCDIFRCYCASAFETSVSKSMHAHRLILEALRRRDADEARKAMVNHIDEALEVVLAAFPALEEAGKD